MQQANDKKPAADAGPVDLVLGLAERAAFLEALNGKRGELDAWLECNNEAEVRAHVKDAIAAAMYDERMRWIAACNAVSDGAERAHRPGVQTVAQVRKLAIDGLA